ncbi:MAG: hypothetical protein CMA05_04735 [Euryarchaeota archaeon]|nr:hypothetical protein [Euryarchaeota archaeon]
MTEKTYTTDDIGKMVTLNIDGVALEDVVVEVVLPGKGTIIGPTFVCAHIFARLTMMEAMMQASAQANDWSDEMA